MITVKPSGHYEACSKCGAHGFYTVKYEPVVDLVRKTCMQCGYDRMLELPRDRSGAER